MLKSIRRTLRELKTGSSGNATLLMALGMPLLIGSGGLAVDTAQWYMWKRELQFAVDQAALAGAWARTSSATENEYTRRAVQELNSNLAVTTEFVGTPKVSIADFPNGTNNSVVVSVSAQRALPFSSMLTGNATTVGVYAQATFEEGANFTSCLLAVDEDDEGSITIGGSSVVTAGCGMAALSTSPESIVVDGSPEIEAGWVVSRGGIDDWFDVNTEDQIYENIEDLYDPFAALSPPYPAESQVQRTYKCLKGKNAVEMAITVPGTYTGGIKVACNTTFAKGVYVIDGGGLEIAGQYSVSGAGVMFVLKNGAYLKINGGTNINLTAIQASDLIARGIPAADANKLAGMLVFEDRSSEGSNKNNINGNTYTVLNGTVYLPKSGIDFTGTATVTSQCLMIAAATIKISGSANMTTFCPPDTVLDNVIGSQNSRVKLVV